MAGIRAGRRQFALPEAGPGPKSKSLGLLVFMLFAVLAAIGLIWNVSRRASQQATAPLASAELVATPAAPPATESEPAPPAMPVAAEESVAAAPSQASITRVIDDGRAGLKACYQRALVRDSTLVHGKLAVRLSIAPSGRVGAVKITGPAAFRAVEPCLEDAIARWTFPAASEAYAAEFPLVLQGAQ
jgi:hypothetical protein